MELVLFELGPSRMAFPARGISKVLEPLPVTPLPYAPPEVEGLVNVGGMVVVKMDLACRLGMPARSASFAGNLLMVAGRDDTVLVQVDKVLNKLTLDEDELTLYDDDGSGSLVRGEFRAGGELVLLLDERLLGLHEVAPCDVPDGGGGVLGHAQDLEVQRDARVQDDDLRLLVMRDGGEVYALPMADVQEIVEISPMTALPGVGDEVDGLMQLRETALLVISLARVLGQPRTAAAGYVIVVAVGGLRLGISIAEVIGIEAHSSAGMQALTVGDSQLSGYVPGIGAWRGRMTGVLSLGGLLSQELRDKYSRFLGKHVPATLALANDAGTVRKLLAFSVAGERCALELSRVDRIEEYFEGSALPDGDGAFPEIIQVKGSLAASLDLRKLLTPSNAARDPADTPVYILVKVNGASWALLADKVDGVISIPESDITPIRTRQSDYLPEVGQLDGRLVSLFSLDPLASRSI